MSKLFVVKVIDGEEQYEYEFGNLPHAAEFIRSEKESCTLWIADTVTGEEQQISLFG